MFASIPSPTSNVLSLGPINFRFYGLLIAVGVVVATRITMWRWQRRGGDPDDIVNGVVIVVLSGVVGARLYHVVTDYQLFTDDWLRAFQIWKGGLAIWGAVIGGAIAVIVLARRKRGDVLSVMDAIAPGLLAAQAIGRWGNWFNQELFGKPTTLPWGLQIDPARRPPGYDQFSTFHPTFLYESLWCLAGFAVLIWLDNRNRLRRGQVVALYVVIYTFGRFFFENLRIDEAHQLVGMRFNAWVSLALFIAGVFWFWWLGRRTRRSASEQGIKVLGAAAPEPT